VPGGEKLRGERITRKTLEARHFLAYRSLLDIGAGPIIVGKKLSGATRKVAAKGKYHLGLKRGDLFAQRLGDQKRNNNTKNREVGGGGNGLERSRGSSDKNRARWEKRMEGPNVADSSDRKKGKKKKAHGKNGKSQPV